MNDSFDNDAMEGWEDLSYDPSVMANLDKKFAPTNGISFLKIAGGTAIVGAAVVSVLYFTVFKKDTTPVIADSDMEQVEGLNDPSAPTKMQVIVLDETDVSLPEPIEQMVQAPKAEQIEPKQISQEFQDIVTFHTETTELPVQELPTIDPIPDPKPEIAKDHKLAQEIYRHSMKLVDYRKYREKPQVKTKQLMLTGTPANQEDQYSEDEDPVWRDVDVPYIDYLDKTVKVFERGNYKKALSRFETILKTYPDDVNANFYAGICLFNLKEYKQAIQHFDNCVNGKFSNFDEEATWMLAECYSKMGSEGKTKAKQIYQTIADGNGFYAKQAKGKLK
ncbi:MAG: tetratricopeptide repeat protein [Crocinitomicaceae bacterium]|nr:tetratricopeptide repeat protein [Crocinitomicaceae bacterium]